MNAIEKKAEDLAAVMTAIADMPDEDRAIAEKLHEIIMTSAPNLVPRTWYGMPAYQNNGKIICFFRSRKKFGERYMTLGFNDTAKIDEGTMWPINFAIISLTDKYEAAIAELIKKSVS